MTAWIELASKAGIGPFFHCCVDFCLWFHWLDGVGVANKIKADAPLRSRWTGTI